MNYLQKLVGKKIIDISYSIGQYFQLGITSESINNPQNVPEVLIQMEDYLLRISNPISLDKKTTSIEDFIGKVILKVVDNDELLMIHTEDDFQLTVDLRQEAFVGPEAMSLNGPDNLIVVRN